MIIGVFRSQLKFPLPQNIPNKMLNYRIVIMIGYYKIINLQIYKGINQQK